MRFGSLLVISLLFPIPANAAERDCTMDIPVPQYSEKSAVYSKDKSEVTEKFDLSKDVSVAIKTHQCESKIVEYKFTFSPALKKKWTGSKKEDYLKAAELLELFEKEKEKPLFQEIQAFKNYAALLKETKLNEELYTRITTSDDGTIIFDETVKIEVEEAEFPKWIKVTTKAGNY